MIWYGRAWRCVCFPDRARARAKVAYAINPEKSRENNKVWCASNPEKKRAHDRAWRAANPEKSKASSRKWCASNKDQRRAAYLKSMYDLSLDQYHNLYTHQRGVCGMPDCSRTLPDGLGAFVDHDYATGRVRGLLCNDCNVKEGQLRKLINRIPFFQAYWRSPPAQQLGLHCVGQKFKKTLGGATP